MIRICLVGVGKRMVNMNLPILNQLKDKIEIVGATTKSGTINEKVGLDIPVYTSIGDMCEEEDPDFVYVSVPHTQTYNVLMTLINYRVPILVDTPISLSLEETYAVMMNSQERNVPIAVVEDWPYLPIECFKKEVIDSGALGKVFSVENDYRTYDYHGFAQLRNYLPDNLAPVSINQDIAGYEIEKCIRKDGLLVQNESDIWRHTFIQFNDGTLLINKYSSFYKKVPFRISNSLRVYGTRGTIIADCLLNSHFKLSILDNDGVSHDLPIEISGNKDNVESISTLLPDGKEIKWENPFVDMKLNEFQVGVAYHIDRMIKFSEGSDSMLYDSIDFFNDLKCFYGKK